MLKRGIRVLSSIKWYVIIFFSLFYVLLHYYLLRHLKSEKHEK